MLDVKQFVEYIIRPTLKEIGYYSEAAENLLIGTAVQESHLVYIQQIKGPAVGVYQCEPNTYNDMWENYINYRSPLTQNLRSIASKRYSTTDIDVKELHGNLNYATAICRVHYMRVSEPLPDANDVQGMAAYWKRYYNTALGAGSIDQFIDNYTNVVMKT